MSNPLRSRIQRAASLAPYANVAPANSLLPTPSEGYDAQVTSPAEKATEEPADQLSNPPRLTFAIAVNDRKMLTNNFLASPVVAEPHDHQILPQENFSSAAKAYNDALDKSVNDLVVFCHQDVLLPQSWLEELQQALAYLQTNDPNWGVLGSCGMTAACKKWRIFGQVYSPGHGIVGEHLVHPMPIQTLDGLLLILRKSSGLRFDERLQNFHFYGADICMIAAHNGLKSYAIPAIAVHNSRHYQIFPREYYEGYWHVRYTWQKYLPIQTTTVRITRSNLPMYKRMLVEAWIRRFGSKHVGAQRVLDGRELLAVLDAKLQQKPAASAQQSR